MTASDSPPLPGIDSAEVSPVEYAVKKHNSSRKGEWEDLLRRSLLRLQYRERNDGTTLPLTRTLHLQILEEGRTQEATMAMMVGMVK